MKRSIKRLPDGEFTILKVIWQLPTPTTSARIMEKLGPDNHWKPQTLLTVLARLTEKGFLESVRKGRERQYTVLISEDEYLEVEDAVLSKHSFLLTPFRKMNWMSCVVCSTKESRMEG